MYCTLSRDGALHIGVPTLQEIHSLPTKIIDGLNSVGNYRRNIDGTRCIIFSTFLLPFTNGIPIKITDGSVP